MRIATILLRAGTDAYADAEANVDARLATQLPGVQRDVIIVDNLLPTGVHEHGKTRVVIGGDNSAREFSGFDAGLRYLDARLGEYDWVNLVTSAFNTLYTDYLSHFTTKVLESAAGRSVCLGHIDYYNDPVRLCGYPSQHWMRTAFIMLPPSELRLLGSLVSVRDEAQFFTGDPAQPFRTDAPICDRLKGYIINWLTGRDIGQGVVWHSTLSLDEKALASFQGKTMAILNEHLLRVRLSAQGCLVSDVSWLALELRSRGAVDWGLSWREQMAACGRLTSAGVAAG